MGIGTIDLLAERVVVDGTHIDRKHKDWKKYLVEGVSHHVVQRLSLKKVLPTESSEYLPDFVEFHDILNDNPNLKAEYLKAKTLQVSSIKEDFIEAVDKFIKNNSKENLEGLQALEKSLSSLIKHKDSEGISMTFDVVFPEDMWT